MNRTALLLTTALTLAVQARAQAPAPAQLPSGMAVVAGGARSVANGATLTVTQGTQRAAIDWRSFDVGARARVQFDTPGSQAVTLNRVTGPAGTTIAGTVTSNGQLVIVNQSGVLVTPSGAIDAQSIVLSAAGITQAGMRNGVAGGHFVLDQAAHPGAAVRNEGAISVKAAGLAALVAPNVSNSGTISAPFGTVHLAGETAQVVDLYGDGLLSLDVSRQTVQVGTQAASQPALVTNDGVIVAQGGRVVLSTAAVDGVVSNLVTAGGTISVDHAGNGGQVVLDAAGGSARVNGLISAHGGAAGGTVAVMASETASVLAGARIDVSGGRGGTVAVGTTLARAAGGPGTVAPRARHTVVASGATIAADAAVDGNGGTITLLSAQQTDFAGSLSARGGAQGGNGGLVEVSGDLGLSFTGAVSALAPHGQVGTLLLDPGDITIVSTGSSYDGTPPPPATISGASLHAIGASVSISTAAGTITVDDTVSLDAGFALRLRGVEIDVTSRGSVTAGGIVDLNATGSVAANGTPAVLGTISMLGTLVSTGIASSGDGQGIVALHAAGGVTVDGVGRGSVVGLIQAPHVTIDGGGALAVNALGKIDASGGTLDLAVGGATNAGTILAGLLRSTAGSSGAVDLSGGTVTVASLGPFHVATGNGSALRVVSTGSLAVMGAVDADVVELKGSTLSLGANVTGNNSLLLGATLGGISQSAGILNTPRLSGDGSIGGSVVLTRGNTVGSLGGITVTGGSLALTDASDLTIGGQISIETGRTLSLAVHSLTFAGDGSGSLQAGGGTVEIAPDVAATMVLGGTATTGSLTVGPSALSHITADRLRLGEVGGVTTASTLTQGASVNVSGVSTVELQSGSGGTTLNATVDAATLLFGSTAGVHAASAPIFASAVGGAGSIANGFDLSNSGNFISRLHAITVSAGSLKIVAGGSLTVDGTVSLAGAGTVRLEAGGNIALGAPSGYAVDAASGTLDVVTHSVTVSFPSSVTQTAPVDVAELDGQVAGLVTLTNAGNTIAAAGSLSAQTRIGLRSTATLDIKGTVGGAGVIVDLSAAALTESTGKIIASILTSSGTIVGSALLGGANAIDTIDPLGVGGTLVLNDVGDLVVGTGVSAASATLTAGGTVTFAAPITLDSAGTLDMQAAGLVVQNAATAGLSSALIQLLEIEPLAGDAVVVGGAGATGTLGIAAGALLTARTVQVGAFGAATPTASGIEIDGFSFAATPGTLLLATTGNVTQTSTGAFTVDTLGGRVGGGLTLDRANNVTHLTTLTLGDSSTLVDAAAVTITGGVSIASGETLSLGLGGLSFATGGSIAASGAVVEIGRRAAGGTLFWGGTHAGAIAADLGAITAGVLRIGSARGIAAATLDLAGLDSAAHAATLDLAAGSLVTEDGTANLAANVVTAALGAGTLDLVGNRANVIAAFGNVTGSTLTVGATAVTVTGTMTSTLGNAGFVTDQFTNQGSISAGTVAIGPVLAGDTVTLGGTALATGAVTATRVRIGSLDGTHTLAGAIAFAGSFDVGPVSGVGGSTLELATTGQVSQSATGDVHAIALTGTAGSVAMLAAANEIGTLGSFGVISGGTLALLDTQALTVAGNVTDPLGHITLQADSVTLGDGNPTVVTTPTLSIVPLLGTGTLGVSSTSTLAVDTLDIGGIAGVAASGSVSVGALAFDGTLLSLLSSGTIGQTAPLTLGTGTTLSAAGGSVQLGSTANAVSILGASSANGDFVLASGAALAVRGHVVASGLLSLTDSSASPAAAIAIGAAGTLDAGSGTVALVATSAVHGGITEAAGGVINAGTLTVAAGAAGASLDLAAGNTIRHLGAVSIPTGALLLADSVPLDISGIVNARDAVHLVSTAVTNGATPDAITQDATATLTTNVLAATASSGNIRLDGAANVVGAVGSLSAPGTVALADSIGVTVEGAVTGTTVQLRVQGLDVGAGNGGTIVAQGGTGLVEVAPFATARIGLGDGALGAGTGALVTSRALGAISAGTLRLGEVAGVVSASGITIAGTVSVGSGGTVQPSSFVLDLQSAGDVDESAGTIAGALRLDVGTLVGAGTLSGSADSVTLDGANTLATLAGFAAPHGFLLRDRRGLAVTQDVSVGAGNLTLAVAGGLTLDGGSLLADGHVVDLTAAGMTEPAGIVVAGTLTSGGTPSGNFALGGGNSIDVLSGWTAPTGSLSLTSTRTLSVAGVSVPGLSLAAPVLHLTGNVTAGAASLVAGTGSIDQTGGTLSAGTLTGSAVLAATLMRPGNHIGTLDAFTAAGIALNDATLLVIDGLVDAQGLVFDLTAAGATETANGGIRAGSLVSSTGTASGTLDLTLGSNSVDTLGTFSTSAASLNLRDQTGLAVAGGFSGAALVLSAPSVAIGATVSADAVGLTATATDVTEGAGGTILAGSLAARADAGAVLLTSAGNSIDAVSAGSALGRFVLYDLASLRVTGQVTADSVSLRVAGLDADSGGAIDATSLVEIASLAAGTLTLGAASPQVALSAAALSVVHAPLLRLGQADGTTTATAIDIEGGFSPSAATLDLETTGGITEAVGGFTLLAGSTLIGSAASVDLHGPNAFDTLGSFTGFVGGGFTLTDIRPLSVPGSLDAAAIVLSADTLTLGGTLAAGTVGLIGTGTGTDVIVLGPASQIAGTTLSLAAPNAAGSIAVLEDAGAVIQVATLTVPEATGVDLTAGSNTIEELGAVTAGTLLLDQGTLAVTGTVAIGGTLSLISAAASGPGITLAGGAILAGQASVTLGTTGAIAGTAIGEAEGFVLAAGTLVASAASGDILLASGANAVTLLGGAASPGLVALTDSISLTIAGQVTADAVRLLVAGLGWSSGGIAAATVEIAPRVAGVLGLGDRLPSLPPLDVQISSAALASIDAGTLTLGRVAGVTSAASIEIDGLVAPALEVLALQSNGGITESGGTIAIGASTLTGVAQGEVVLGAPNVVGVLGDFTATRFLLDVAGSLTVAGDVTAPAITLATSGSLTLGAGSNPGHGRLLAAGGTVDLTASGASQLAGATIEAAILQSSGVPSGVFALTQGNSIDALGGFAGPSASLALTSVRPLTVSGPVSVAELTLAAPTLTLAGAVTVSDSFAFAAGAGGVRQSAGTLSATTLGGTAGGDVAIVLAGNSVADLGTTTATNFALRETGPLAVTGTVTAGTVDLTAAGITEPSGVIRAHVLTSSFTPTGTLVLGGANSIDVLGRLVAPAASLLLHDTAPLTITGAPSGVLTADGVSVGALAAGVTLANLTLSGPAFVVAGQVNAAMADVSASSGGLSETAAGVLVAGTLQSAGGIVGGVTLLDTPSFPGANQVAVFGSIAVTGDFTYSGTALTTTVAGTVRATNITLSDDGTLTVADGGTLAATGSISLTAIGPSELGSGALQAGVLNLAALGGADSTLSGPNLIGQLGSVTSAGLVMLRDSQALTVAGPVAVARMRLVAPSLTLAGTLVATSGLDLTTLAGSVVQTGGAIDTANLSSSGGIAGGLDLSAGTNAIATLGPLSVTAGLTIADTGDLALTGPVSAPAFAHFSIGGTLSDSGGTLATAQLAGSAASVSLLAANAVATVGDFTAAGTFALSDAGDLALTGVLQAASVRLSAGGAISQPGGRLVTPGHLAIAAASAALAQGNAVAILGDVTAPGGFRFVNAASLAIDGQVATSTFDLTVAGDATQTGGAIAATQVGSSGGISGNLALTQPGNRIAAMGGIGVGGTLTLVDSQDLALDGGIGAIRLDLTDGGSVTQTAGAISVQALSSTGGIVGNLTLAQDGNAVPVVDGLAVGGVFTLRTATGLAIDGPLTASGGAIEASGIGFAGDVVVPGTLTLTSHGLIGRSAGRLAVGTLTGSAESTADFGRAAEVGTIAAFDIQDSGDVAGAADISIFRLFNGSSLTLRGPVSADYIRVGAVGLLTWAGNLVTLGLPRIQQDLAIPADPGTVLSVTPDAAGQARIVQTGLVRVIPQDRGLATVRLQLPATGGSITFAELEAPSTDLLLFTGSGSATGLINVGDLLVSGQQGQVNLIGSVRGLVGTAAARDSNIAPIIDTHYRINDCPLQSVNCVVLPTETLPVTNPLRDLSIGQARDDQDDYDLLLPNVSDRDY